MSIEGILSQFGVAGLMFIIWYSYQKASEKHIVAMIDMQREHQKEIYEALKTQMGILRETTTALGEMKGTVCPALLNGKFKKD